MPMLLENASATGSAVGWSGGAGVFSVVGTFGGAEVSLQFLGPDGSTWVAMGDETTKTSAGGGYFVFPPGQIRAAITGGPPSGMYASVDQVRA